MSTEDARLTGDVVSGVRPSRLDRADVALVRDGGSGHPGGYRRDVLTPETDERRVAVGARVVARPDARLVEVGRDGGGRRRRGRRPRRVPRGLMELEMVASAYTEAAAVRSEQRQTLRRTAEAVEDVSMRLRRQSEETMLDGLQGDPARVAYLTLALHLRDTADAIAESLRGLELAEQAMQEAHEEFTRIEKIELAPAHRSLLALGEPVAISGVGVLAPADAQKHWMAEVGKEQKLAARQAMQRFEADMARAASLMRPVEIPEIYDRSDVDDPTVVGTPPTPPVAPTAPQPETTEPAAPAASVGGGAAAGAAAAGAARHASARRGGGYRSAGAGSSTAPARDTWVSTRHQHDTGPDGTMAPAGSGPGAGGQSAAAAGAGVGAAGAAAAPMVPTSHGSSDGEAESGTAIVRSSQEDEAAAAIVAAAGSSSGSRSTIETAPTESEDW